MHEALARIKGGKIMKSFFSAFVKSAKEFTNIRCLTITGIFIAISMILEMYSINLQFVKINFAFLAIAVIGMLFGPTVGFFAGLICDVVGFMVNPIGGFLPAYTLVAGFQGIIYGCCLYVKCDRHSIILQNNITSKQRDITLFLRAILARLLDVVVINLLINTKLSLYYGFIPTEAYSTAIVARVAKNIIELVADIPLLFILLPTALIAYKRLGTKQTAKS
jgi:ECF transporter S component (folate family)